MIIFNNKIYIFGGRNEREIFNDVWTFDLEKNQWKEEKCVGKTF
jgi:N-acetylneuraminic acid mutarotase